MRASRANKGVRPADAAIRDTEADIYQSKDWADISVNVEEGVASGSGSGNNKDRRIMAAMGKKQQLSVRGERPQTSNALIIWMLTQGPMLVETIQLHIHDLLLVYYVGDLGSPG